MKAPGDVNPPRAFCAHVSASEYEQIDEVVWGYFPSQPKLKRRFRRSPEKPFCLLLPKLPFG